jgi:hypothetical protein
MAGPNRAPTEIHGINATIVVLIKELRAVWTRCGNFSLHVQDPAIFEHRSTRGKDKLHVIAFRQRERASRLSRYLRVRNVVVRNPHYPLSKMKPVSLGARR